jgi:hypothetical protein
MHSQLNQNYKKTGDDNRAVIHVWLDRRDRNIKHPFFCCNCRNMIMEYTGDVVSITARNEDEKMPTQVIQCSNNNCRTRFRFVYVSDIAI